VREALSASLPDATPQGCLWIGPGLSRGGGAATHLRQLLLHMQTPGLSFASFGECPDIAVGQRMFKITDLGHRGWRDYPRTISKLAGFISRLEPKAVIAFGPQPLIAASAALRVSGASSGLGYIEITRPFTATRYAPAGLSGWVNSALLRMALSRVQIAAANSRDGLDELTGFITPYHTQVRLVRNPVDLHAWSGDPRRQDGSSPLRILSTGRLVPSKGFGDLIQAAAGLSRRFALTVAIAGEGPQRAALERQAAALGIVDRVQFLGWVADLRSEMQRADVFVFPSHYEGFPNSVLEAMASARPVVSSFWGTDAGSLHAAGVIRGYPPGDVAALSSALADLLESSDVRAHLAERGRCHARGFAIAEVIRDYDSLVRDLQGMAA
jgi:glycosyltransferase involved in cell wall biosynthesis